MIALGALMQNSLADFFRTFFSAPKIEIFNWFRNKSKNSKWRTIMKFRMEILKQRHIIRRRNIQVSIIDKNNVTYSVFFKFCIVLSHIWILTNNSKIFHWKLLTILCGRWTEKSMSCPRLYNCCSCSVTKSCPTLWPNGLQHTRLPCHSLSPGVSSNSCPLNLWYPPTITSSIASFSSFSQSFPASWFFPMSQLFASDDSSIGASASASDLPMKIQGQFPNII